MWNRSPEAVCGGTGRQEGAPTGRVREGAAELADGPSAGPAEPGGAWGLATVRHERTAHALQVDFRAPDEGTAAGVHAPLLDVIGQITQTY